MIKSNNMVTQSSDMALNFNFNNFDDINKMEILRSDIDFSQFNKDTGFNIFNKQFILSSALANIIDLTNTKSQLICISFTITNTNGNGMTYYYYSNVTVTSLNIQSINNVFDPPIYTYTPINEGSSSFLWIIIIIAICLIAIILRTFY